MKRGLPLVLVAIASVMLVGCGGKKQPSGQVVATVGKEEITAIDLKNEMAGFNNPDPKIRKAAERQALDSIVTRKILAQAAKKAKIDKTPTYAQQEQRVKEGLLVQVWQNQLAAAVPPPSGEEIDKFIAEHPTFYGSRTVWLVDQIRMARPSNPAILQALQPMTTLPQIEQYLVANKIPAAKGTTRLDALSLPAEVADQIQKLPPGEVFVLPAQNLLLVNQVRETQVAPLTGQAARNHAQQYLRSARTREALQRQFGGIVQQARKNVKFAKAYEPAPPAKAAPKAAPGKAPPALAAPATGG
jgi:EpsD family peptidyl-prolyl cis-trans isomerase